MSQLCEKHPNHFLWILNCSAFLSNLLGSFVNKVAFCFGYIVSILYWACNKLATSVLCSTSSILQYLYILLNFIIYKGSLKTNGNTVYGVAWIIYTGIIDNIHVWLYCILQRGYKACLLGIVACIVQILCEESSDVWSNHGGSKEPRL